VSTQSLETTLIVKSGETLVAGGLIKDVQGKVDRKLPVLGDIPFLGAAFRSNTVDFTKSELVIFLTPYIVTGDNSTREARRYFNSKGEMLDFDKVGGYDFGIAQTHSQGAFDRNNTPYWEIQKRGLPQYWNPKELYTRDKPYQDRVNQFEGSKEGKMPSDPKTLRKNYQAKLGQKVVENLEPLKELETFNGQIDLAVMVRRDGVVENISFADSGDIKDAKLKRTVIQAIQGGGPFPEFPKGLDSDKELFNVRLGIQKAG
jgi:hypothetical protein